MTYKPESKKSPSTTFYKSVRQACDCCRRRKIRCDAAQPCAPCNNSSLRCTYSHVLRNKGPKYACNRSRTLETRSKTLSQADSSSPTTPTDAASPPANVENSLHPPETKTPEISSVDELSFTFDFDDFNSLAPNSPYSSVLSTV